MMTYESLNDGGFATGTMMGSGGFIVLDEDQCVVRHTLSLARFYHHESCGQCSPCREGTGWMEKVLKNIEHGKGKMSDIDLLWDIQRKIEGNTICPSATPPHGRWPPRSVTSVTSSNGTCCTPTRRSSATSAWRIMPTRCR